MPTQLHESLIEMFRERPTLAAEILSGPLHVAVPSFDAAELAPNDLNEIDREHAYM